MSIPFSPFPVEHRCQNYTAEENYCTDNQNSGSHGEEGPAGGDKAGGIGEHLEKLLMKHLAVEYHGQNTCCGNAQAAQGDVHPCQPAVSPDQTAQQAYTLLEGGQSLLRGDRMETVAKAGTLNPQAQYGADVIMRANYALERGCDVLASCVREAVDCLIGQLCQDAGVEREDVFAVSLVGNTCMHHLFLAISPDSLVHAPYNPAISEPLLLRSCDYGLRVNPRAPLLMLPVIAGFVGADTVGCLLAGGWETLEELTLMIDIGTNGEIVMGSRERMIACSTAAGPGGAAPVRRAG